MRRIAILTGLISAVLAPPVCAATVVVTAAHMIDVLSGKVVDRPQVTIIDGRISAVGHIGDAVPAAAQRIDLGARTILPGLIDMHVHLTADPTLSGYQGLEYTDNFWTVVGVAIAVDGDPLADVKILQDVAFVMKGGEVVKPAP